MARGINTIAQRIALEGGEQIKRELQQFGFAGEKVFKGLQAEANKVVGPPRTLITRLREAGREMERVGKQFRDVGAQMQRTGALFSAAVTAPIAAIGGVALRSFADFEKGISNVSTLIDTSTESLREMETAVLGISKRVPVSIGDLTAGLYDVRSAGIDAADAMNVLENSARLGVAGLGTTASAVNVVTSAINAFGLEGEEQARVYDLIFTAVKNGKTTIDQLAQGFGGVAGTVAQAGVQIDEFLAAVAALTTTGLRASEAYTQIRAAIAGLTRETELSSEVFGRLGVSTFKELIQVSGGLVPALARVRDAVAGNDAVIVKLFGSIEAYNAVVGLTGNQNKAFVDTLNDMRDGISNVDEAFEKQRQTVDAAFQSIANSLERARIAIGRDLVPTFLELRDGIDRVLEGFTSLDPETRKLGILFAGVVAAIGPLILALGVLAFAIDALLGPIGLVLLAFTSIGAAFAGLYIGSEKFRTIINGLAGALGDTAQAAYKFADSLPGLIGSNEDAAGAAEAHAKALGEIKKAFDEAKRGAPGAAAAFDQVAEAQLRSAQAAVVAAKALFEQAAAEYEAFFRQVQSSIFGGFGRSFEEAKLLEALVEAQDRLAAAQDRLSSIEGLIAESRKNLSGAAGDIGKGADASADGVNKVADAFDGVGDAVDKTTKKVSDLEKKFKDLEKRGFTALARSLQGDIVDPSGGAELPGPAVDSGALETLRADFAKLLAEVPKSEAAIRGVGEALDEVEQKANSGDLAGAAESLVQVDFTPLKDAGVEAFDEIERRANEALAAIRGQLASLGGGGATAVGDEGKAGLGGGPFQGIVDSIAAVRDGLASLDFAPVQASGVAAFEAIEARAREALAAIEAGLAALGGAAAAAAEGEGGAGGGAGGGEEAAAGGGGAFQALATAAQTAFATIRAELGTLAAEFAVVLEAIGASAEAVFAAFEATVTAAFASTRSQIETIAEQIRAIVADLIAEMRRLQEAARAALAAAQAARSGGAQGFAGGGRVSAPGDGSRDTILAGLANNEYVLRAYAAMRLMRRYGVAFLDHINRTGEIPGFAAGGLVEALGARLALPMAPAPALAVESRSGGLTGRPVVLNIGGRRYELAAPEGEALRLERDFRRDQLAQTSPRFPYQTRRNR